MKTFVDDQDRVEKPPVFNVNQDRVTSLTTFKPQAPRNCRVKAKGSTFIWWEWEPPISDGGLPITEYELSYVAKVKVWNKDIGKNKITTTIVDSMKTSHWALIPPVCHSGFKMVGLNSASEYRDFKIRCWNLQGWSPWQNMIIPTASASGHIASSAYSVFTDEPDPPSPPLMFAATKITSSCIHINWQPPYYDGGQDIVDYMVFYTPVERHFTATSRNVMIERNLSFSVGSGSDVSAVIRNITPDTEVVRIHIKAVSRVGLLSEATPLGYDLKTNPACRYTQIEHQIHLTMNTKVTTHSLSGLLTHLLTHSLTYSLTYLLTHLLTPKDEFIDTDFYAGIQQRMRRVDFLRMLTNELKVTEQDPEELMEAKEWQAVKRMVFAHLLTHSPTHSLTHSGNIKSRR
jgi:hypothetical protein